MILLEKELNLLNCPLSTTYCLSDLKIAAIDIGSNAIRLQIVTTQPTPDQQGVSFKKIEYIRCPLRLGRSVFETGYINEELQQKFIKLMQAFKNLMEIFDVTAYMACATSAMREASNGEQLAEETLKATGIKVRLISGTHEADLVNKAISQTLTDAQNYLHIDVGGGSTELNLYVNHEKVATSSFLLGSVRRMLKQEDAQIWVDIKQWIKKNVAPYSHITVIGTGGNINKLAKLAQRDRIKTKTAVSYKKLKEVQTLLRGMTIQERIETLMLNGDRADVIVPASEIYLYVMERSEATKIIVPELGLKDGIIQSLYEAVATGSTEYHLNQQTED